MTGILRGGLFREERRALIWAAAAFALGLALCTPGEVGIRPAHAQAIPIPQSGYTETPLPASSAQRVNLNGAFLLGTCAWEIQNEDSADIFIGFDHNVSDTHFGRQLHPWQTTGDLFSITFTSAMGPGGPGGTAPQLWLYSVHGTSNLSTIHIFASC